VQIIPALDIIGGKCVRLTKGNYDKQVIYHEHPLDAAKAFEDAGLERLHIVDLDGAKMRTIQNLEVLETIASRTKLIVDFGGGVNTIEDVSNVFNAGASIVTIGSIAVRHPEVVEEWLLEFGADKILVGADVLDNKIKISGWMEETTLTVFEFIGKILALGGNHIFCTDISKDGMLKGPSIELYKEIRDAFPMLELIASGGVRSISDIIELKNIGCKGVIVGKAIYEGKIMLSQLSKINSQS
jgi:phosphoribosylformimino-5-aminoimidazole carboxamide ribotide isomerase